MNMDELREWSARFAWEREMRHTTGIGLYAAEFRLHDVDQSALMEFIERAAPQPKSHIIRPSLAFGVPLRYDPEVPRGVLRAVMEDGSTQDHRLT
jgi:hypothetical protein